MINDVISKFLYNHATGADGVKIAVLRKGFTSSEFINAAVHSHVIPKKRLLKR
jgi:hypothetical protein